MSATTDPDGMAAEIQTILRNYGTALDLAVDEAAKETGKNAVRELRQTSPKGYRGKYAKGWALKVQKKGCAIVYNKEYQLTHLLEHGHKTRLKTGQYGKKANTAAQSHIADVADKVEQEFPEAINKHLKIQ